jgi:hypothetical protein
MSMKRHFRFLVVFAEQLPYCPAAPLSSITLLNVLPYVISCEVEYMHTCRGLIVLDAL